MERTDPTPERVPPDAAGPQLSSSDLQKTQLIAQVPPAQPTPRPAAVDPDKTMIRDLSGVPDRPEMTSSGLADTRATQLRQGPAGSGTPMPTGITQLHVAAEGSENAAGTHHGEVWDDFKIGELLGRGGMGAVYKGLQLSLDRPVAIKVLPQELSLNENFRNRFQLEAKAVARLSSPNVIQVYAAGSHLGKNYFAMEYVEGKDIAMRMRAGFRPSPQEALELVTQAARGLAAAGELGIVHRDIKPANMMLTSKGVLKIMDFGLVKLASEDQSLTMSGTIMGTVSYFSPEQGRGERCDCRTDIYALGVVFYEMLSGQLPFRGADATSIIYQHIHTPPKPLIELDASIPASYQAVVDKCMAKSADDRYQDATQLLQDLQRLGLGQVPLGAGPASAAASTARPGRGLVLAGVALGVVILAGVAALLLHHGAGAAAVPAAPLASATPVTPAAMPAANPVPVAGPVQAPPPAAPASSPGPATPDANAGMALVQQGRLDEARALADQVLANDPANPAWTAVAAAITAAHSDRTLEALRQALGRSDLPAALAAQAQARAALGETPALQALDQRVAALQARERRIAQAEGALDNGDVVTALAQLTALDQEQPNDPQVTGLLGRASALSARADEIRKSVLEQLHNADLAIAQKDYDAALISYTAVKGMDPTSVAASTGLDRIAKIKSAISEERSLFDADLASGDLAKATDQLAKLRDLAPGSPTLVVAEDQLSTAKMSTERSQRENDQREARIAADAQTLLKRLADPKEPLPDLEASAAALLPVMDNGNADRALIQSRLDDRRAHDQVAGLLLRLDAAVVAGDKKTITSLVADSAFADQLVDLHSYQGLVYESRLSDLQRHDQDATAQVLIRTAMALSPESTLKYSFDLHRDSDATWQIVAAHLLQ